MKLDARRLDALSGLVDPANLPQINTPRSMSWVQLRIVIFVSLLALDVACVVGSFVVASIFRGTSVTDTSLLVTLAVIVPVYVGTAINTRAYETFNLQDPFSAIAKGVQSFVLTICAVFFVAFCLKASDNFSRIVMTLGILFSVFSLGLGRYFFVRHIEELVGGNPYRVILICDGEQTVPDGKFAAIVAADASFDPDVHDPLMYDRLAKVLETADRVVVACNPDRRMAWAHALKGANIQSEILAPELKLLAPLGVSSHGHTPSIIVGNGPLSMFDRLVKRVFDIAVATTALILLAPVFLVVALLVKWDSPGPVLFKQTRIGRGNQIFRMLKFRSMQVENSDLAGDRSTARGDDRITRIGNFIRKTSLDELPQLVNVLKGDMSIVGPRPHALGSRAADKLFWEVDQRYWHRHAARPGLTGLAQVLGYRGATLLESDLQNRLDADLEYLENWSIWRDLKIIFLTFRVLLHRNAF